MDGKSPIFLGDGGNITEDINKLIKENFDEDKIVKNLKCNPQIVELYLSSSKYGILLPDILIKYIIESKLDIE